MNKTHTRAKVTTVLAIMILASLLGLGSRALATPRDMGGRWVAPSVVEVARHWACEAAEEAAEDRAEAQRAIALGDPEAKEELAEAERSARIAEEAQRLAEAAESSKQVELPAEAYAEWYDDRYDDDRYEVDDDDWDDDRYEVDDDD